MMVKVHLRRAAWYGDEGYNIWFPEDWDVLLAGAKDVPALNLAALENALLHPVASQPLSRLALGRKRVAILVDDLSRPTPAAQLIGLLLGELVEAGIALAKVTIFIAGGTHPPYTDQELVRKIGELPPAVMIQCHDSRADLIDLGTSKRGTPVTINRQVMQCDLKIGVGCIYPHPTAAFSGGSKILVPGLAGYETIRYMHDHLIGSQRRGGRLDNEFRLELEDLADRLGLDFVANAVLNPQRQIAALFSGDRSQAFRQAVAQAIMWYRVKLAQPVDIVVADMYPFDADLQFAFDRGMWPIYETPGDTLKVILADCPRGIGWHSLYPVTKSVSVRLMRRLKNFRWRDIKSLSYRLRVAARLLRQKPLEVWMLSRGIPPQDFSTVFPRGHVHQDWQSLLLELQSRQHSFPVRVAIYQCAPFLLPDIYDE
jgi:nickel-dependent lactate racemase